ncbi:thiamine phosphate synthase [Lederbergia lenta]|uniref:Transcriptional regulator TenI n=1 Tax=Lederbergia lenta TaxID=1467 RepID=A0A2X4VZ67_LEDLE|nr:thiamine phosphate synthase [Lederbergia lenta]MCM3111432.1 thiamine phosphate synthase [Lederbergia lenta]MEC2325182.1 thiamine phosphate synthase [Lederbergia lenta]SQI56063.1 transcriptional regulator TenI [Lederbergia lenta]
MKLITVTDDRMTENKLVHTLLHIEPYVSAIILREKSKSEETLKMIIETLYKNKFDLRKLIIHGNRHLAISTGINRVQLPNNAPPINGIKLEYPQLSLGRSIHSIDNVAEPVDWLLYGHIYKTACKKGIMPRGLKALREITFHAHCPVYAIGGIKPEHVQSIRDAGAAGIAVMSSIFGVAKPEKAAKEYAKACEVSIHDSIC